MVAPSGYLACVSVSDDRARRVLHAAAARLVVEWRAVAYMRAPQHRPVLARHGIICYYLLVRCI